jgi:hypothetical protein
VLLTGILATVGLGGPSSAAAAAPTSTRISGLTPSLLTDTPQAEITRYIVLDAQSTGSATLPYDEDRDIYLIEGTYYWKNTFLDSSGDIVNAARTIDLKAGWYKWGCTLTGTGAAFPDFNYQTMCVLGDPVRHLLATLPYAGIDQARLHAGGYYWTSSLSRKVS